MFRTNAPTRRLALWTVIATCAMGTAPAMASSVPPGHEVRRQPAHPVQSHFSMVDIGAADVAPGGITTLRVLVANRGPDRTASTFDVKVALPSGATAVGPFFPSSCRADPTSSVVFCTFPAGLPAYRTATVLVPVRVAPTARPNDSLPGEVTLSSRDDSNGIISARCALHTAVPQPDLVPPPGSSPAEPQTTTP